MMPGPVLHVACPLLSGMVQVRRQLHVAAEERGITGDQVIHPGVSAAVASDLNPKPKPYTQNPKPETTNHTL